jgi:cyanate permease
MMFLVGLVSAAIVPGIHKAAAEWFPKRQLGMANGIVMVGIGVGQTAGAMLSATILSPLLGGWRNVMFLYGSLPVILGILWLTSRSKPRQASSDSHASAVPLRQSLSRVVRIKDLWILGFSAAGLMGCYRGALGYLPLYLQGIGWDIASASGVVAVTGAVAMAAAIPISLLSDRLGTRKKIMAMAAIVCAAAAAVLPLLNGPSIWAAVIIMGIPVTGYLGLMVTISTEAEGVGVAAATSMGLVLTIFRLGGIIAPPLGNSLAEANPGSPFFLWAAMAVLGVIGLYFIKDTGRKRAKPGQ